MASSYLEHLSVISQAQAQVGISGPRSTGCHGRKRRWISAAQITRIWAVRNLDKLRSWPAGSQLPRADQTARPPP